jgi:broad specificity phosphatase PhoE
MPTSPHLILVKHSLPEIVPGEPAAAWRLSPEGRARCRPLAEKLAAYRPRIVVSSVEPKARETAEAVAATLGCGLEVVAGLQEHERSSVPFMSKDAFEAAVAAFFARPTELVFGEETADLAHVRFAAAVDGVLAHHAGQTVAIVAHGTVITLFAARATGLEPLSLWKTLGLPSFVVFSLPVLRLLRVVGSVD